MLHTFRFQQHTWLPVGLEKTWRRGRWGFLCTSLACVYPTRLPFRECLDPIFTGTAGPLGPNFLHILTQRVQFYLMVQFSLARGLPTPLGYPSGNVWIPYLRGQQVPWGRIFYIFWHSESSSTLWYSFLWLARFQPHSATPPGMFGSHIYGDSRSNGAEFFTYSDTARPVLPYGTVFFGWRASNPTRLPLRECLDPIFTGTPGPLGPNFLHSLTQRVQFYLMVQFSLASALPTPLDYPSGNVSMPYLRGQQVPWGRIFYIFWHSASSSTLWYSFLWFARFRPHSATLPGMFGSHMYGDSRSLGAKFFTYSDTARPVLPYGTVFLGWRASNPTRLPLRECLDPICTGTAGPLGPNFLHILTHRVQFYLMVQFSLACALPTPLGYASGNVWILYLRGQHVPWGRIFYIFLHSASSSNLWYSFLCLPRFQPHSATPSGMFGSHIYGDSRSLGAELFTYSDTARPVLPYSTVFFASRASNPTRLPIRESLDPICTGTADPWDRIFYIFWHSASSSTLWYSFLWLAPFQPHSATPPGMFGSHMYGDSRLLGAELFTYSDTSRPVLPYGTVFFGSRASNPTRLPLRECFYAIFTGTAGPLGPNFLHILTQRVQFYLTVQFSLARALPTLLGYPSANVWIPYLRGRQVL